MVYEIDIGNIASLVTVFHDRSAFCWNHLFDFTDHPNRLASSNHMVGLCAEPIQNRSKIKEVMKAP